MLYVKKPVVVEAFKLGTDPQPEWFRNKVKNSKAIINYDIGGMSVDIETLEGWHRASPGDYIIKGVKGEIYPCKPDIFALTYEEVVL